MKWRNGSLDNPSGKGETYVTTTVLSTMKNVCKEQEDVKYFLKR